MAFKARETDKQLRFFSQKTGAMWQTLIDDTFDAEAIYIKAGSEFINILQKLLKDTGETFDSLAGLTSRK